MKFSKNVFICKNFLKNYLKKLFFLIVFYLKAKKMKKFLGFESFLLEKIEMFQIYFLNNFRMFYKI